LLLLPPAAWQLDRARGRHPGRRVLLLAHARTRRQHGRVVLLELADSQQQQ
jgi:hypothetical protein